MPNYEVIVGNVGSVHFGKRRAEALKRYKTYVESSKEQLGLAATGKT